MINLNSNWKFKDVQENIEVLIAEFEGKLALFLWNRGKEKRQFLNETKHQVFNYENLLYWQRERLWETLNGDLQIEDFERIGK